MKKKEKRKKKKKYKYYEEYKLACTNYNELVFIANEIINIAIILNATEYKITQKLKVDDSPIRLSILDNKICCIYSYFEGYFLLFEKKGNEYKQIKETQCINGNILTCRENFKFKNWEIELARYRGMMFLSINRSDFRFAAGGNFKRNQKLFIEPSFLILGDLEVLINLEKLKKKDFKYKPNEYTIRKATFMKVKEERPKIKNICYENLNDSSFLYLDEGSYLYQILFGEKKFDFKISEKREDIRGFFFIRKDNLLFILNKKKINIYHF